MEAMRKQLKMVAENVTGAILKSVGAHNEEIKWVIDRDNTILRMNSYPSCPEPDRAIGTGPHKDTSILTFLHQVRKEAETQSNVPTQDRTKGLQIFKEGIGWVIVNPDPDEIVVNVGDVLEILSNGRFKSVVHRVTVSASHRYSLAHFIVPSPDTLLYPIDSPPRFHAITFREFKNLKLQDPLNIVSSISI